MKRLMVLVCAVLSIVACSARSNSNGGGTMNSSNGGVSNGSKSLIAYFSWSDSHNTETMANYVKDITGSDVFEIVPETPYSSNYSETVNVAQKEKNDNARPRLKHNITDEELKNYDVIFLGYPIWWYDAPMIIYSFLESHDFTGKTIIPFATSGGSRINEESKFKSITGADVKEGLTISHFSAGDRSRKRVEDWLSNLGYTK